LSDALDQYLGAMSTASVVVIVLSLAALSLRRLLLTAFGFLTLGIGAAAIVWDHWSARAGHHMEVTAFVHPVQLTSRDALLLATHAPFLVAGVALLVLSARANAARSSPP